MTLNAQDFAGRARDSRWESDLARRLRPLPEAEKLQFVKDLLKSMRSWR
jgi:hypothetical protein